MKKNPGIAGVLSFFMPGTGFIYCERYIIGILVFLLWTFVTYSAFFRGGGLGALGFSAVIWLISIWRSAKSAIIINDIIDELDSKST